MLTHAPTLCGIPFIYNPLILTVMLLETEREGGRERGEEREQSCHSQGIPVSARVLGWENSLRRKETLNKVRVPAPFENRRLLFFSLGADAEQADLCVITISEKERRTREKRQKTCGCARCIRLYLEF